MKSKLSGQELIKTVSQISKKYPYYTMACLLLAVLLVDYSLVMRFQWNTLRSVNPEITRLSREVQVTKNNMRRMSRFREETRNLKSQIEQMNRKLKSREEILIIGFPPVDITPFNPSRYDVVKEPGRIQSWESGHEKNLPIPS